MVAAVVTVGLAVVAWTIGNFSAQQQETGEFFSDRSQTIRENFVIEDVWFYSGGVNVTVRNVGTVNMTVEAINFNGTNRLVAAQNIATGEAKTITITWDWGSGTKYYYIVVASARGQQVREFYSTSG